MKLNKLVLIPLAALLLAGCAQAPSEGNSDSTNQNVLNDTLTLKMIGDIYLNGYRTIYASLENNSDVELEWSSSNEDVATVTPKIDNTLEANILAKSHGKTTITATAVGHPNITASKEIEIKEGTVMPKDLFDSLGGSIRADSVYKVYDVDPELNYTETDKFEILTIFEEYREFTHDSVNTTDGYKLHSLKVLSEESKVERTNINVVRSDTNKVATEYRDIYNQLKYQVASNDRVPDGEKWLDSFRYKNPFFNMGINNTSFITVDNGKTYQYVGGDEEAIGITEAFYLNPNQADAIYFKTLDNNELELHIEYEPNGEGQTRYAFEYVANFSEKGTAKVDHVELFKEEAYHAPIKAAFDEIKNSKNYTVSYKLGFANPKDDYITTQTYNPDTIHEVKTDLEGTVTAEGGVHLDPSDKNPDLHFGYSKKDGQWIKKTLLNKWKDEYPTYYFSPLIFEPTDKPNEYQTIDKDMGAFVGKIMRLPRNFYFFSYDFERGYLTLDEQGHIASAKTVATDPNSNEKINIEATFSKVGTSVIDMNWEDVHFPPEPTTWSEIDNKMLYDDMHKWGIDGILPFLNNETGFNDVVSPIKDGNTIVGVAISTKNHPLPENQIDLDKARLYVENYKKLLVANGYTLTEEVTNDHLKFPLYKKGSNRIAVGLYKNKPNQFQKDPPLTGEVRISLYNPTLKAPDQI